MPDSRTSSLSVAFDAGQPTSDGGLVWLACADDRLGMSATCAAQVRDWRRGPVRHPLTLLVRQRLLQIACGLVAAIRARWPHVAIALRADSGFAIPALYAYCERQRITYTISLAPNTRLQALAALLVAQAQQHTNRPARSAAWPARGAMPLPHGRTSAISSTKPSRWPKGAACGSW